MSSVRPAVVDAVATTERVESSQRSSQPLYLV
jgi:hypothetical protein